MSTLTQPLKWHGGKSYLAKKIVDLMPPHPHYVEPYFGGGAVLLEKEYEGISEVVNDLNGDLTNFWQVLQEPVAFAAFCRRVEAVPFSEVEWTDTEIRLPRDSILTALNFFIRCRQSRAGQMRDFATVTRNRTRHGMNEQVSAWLGAIEGLPAVHARLKRVLILNRDALDVIRQNDEPTTLFYCDPPYLHETRTSKNVYEHEMTKEQHADLLNVLTAIKGKFMLSGYRSELYDGFSQGYNWNRHDFEIDNKAAGGKKKRTMTECVWCNF